MGIPDALLASPDVDAPVRSILVGAHWTVVYSRQAGMTAILKDDHLHERSPVREAGRLHTKTARELVEYARSDNLLEASIGMAAINSLLEIDERSAVEINTVEVHGFLKVANKLRQAGQKPDQYARQTICEPGQRCENQPA